MMLSPMLKGTAILKNLYGFMSGCRRTADRTHFFRTHAGLKKEACQSILQKKPVRSHF